VSGATAPETGPDPAENPAEPDLPYLDVQLPSRVYAHVRLSQPATLWYFPLEPVVQSEAGYERAYQGVVFLHQWPIHLPPHGFWEVNFDIKILVE